MHSSGCGSCKGKRDAEEVHQIGKMGGKQGLPGRSLAAGAALAWLWLTQIPCASRTLQGGHEPSISEQITTMRVCVEHVCSSVCAAALAARPERTQS